MPLTVDWPEIVFQLLLTLLAGTLVGWNRGENGHPAGMRTTILVCLAASLSMIEANLLLDTSGKAQDAFAVLDVARLPLGVLSGIGFIGAGTIIHRGSLIEGVTTAATMWFMTLVGLCLGGGQLGLGIGATVIGFLVLSALKRFEDYLPIDRRATIDLTVEGDGSIPIQFAGAFAEKGYRIVERGARLTTDPARRQILYEVHWRAPAGRAVPTDWLDALAHSPGVVELAWQVGPLTDRGTTRPPIP
jgi:putative Mg2+ transporter-C (MgtC) family protein